MLFTSLYASDVTQVDGSRTVPVSSISSMSSASSMFALFAFFYTTSPSSTLASSGSVVPVPITALAPIQALSPT